MDQRVTLREREMQGLSWLNEITGIVKPFVQPI